jgi:hypothetical protein
MDVHIMKSNKKMVKKQSAPSLFPNMFITTCVIIVIVTNFLLVSFICSMGELIAV